MSAVIGAGAVVAPSILSSCAKGSGNTPLRPAGSYYVPELPDKADAGRELKVGVIGCGGRATGATINLLDAADGITVYAAGDVFADRIASFQETIGERGQHVDPERVFVGFDAYKKVIDSGVDMVIIATPPVFRPEHFKYATFSSRPASALSGSSGT